MSNSTYRNLVLAELAKVSCIDLTNFEYSHPIEVEALANRLGLNVILSHFNKSGELNIENKTIVVNAKEHPFRQRFTVAHELGHYAKGHGTSDRDEINSYSDENKSREKEVNNLQLIY